MTIVFGVLGLLGGGVIFRAWLANRYTTLAHALAWAGAAWLFWTAFLVLGPWSEAGQLPWRYTGLCLTGGACVAVLGARRPIVGPWNFVVLGLLAVLLLPLVESLFLAAATLGIVRMAFLGATLAIGAVNYLPTSNWPAALLFLVACTAQCWFLFAPAPIDKWQSAALHVPLMLVPIATYLCWHLRRRRSDEDALWLDFRDRYGLVWGQRVREQFNRAAANAAWPVQLGWGGFSYAASKTTALQAEVLTTLQALLKRFGPV